VEGLEKSWECFSLERHCVLSGSSACGKCVSDRLTSVERGPNTVPASSEY